jgi:hypothetical protein
MGNLEVLLLGGIVGGVSSAGIVYFRVAGRVRDYRSRIQTFSQSRQTLQVEVARRRSSWSSAVKDHARIKAKEPLLDDLRERLQVQHPPPPDL